MNPHTPRLGTSRLTVLRTLGSGAVRALIIPGSSFVVLPLLLSSLGARQYGIWATLSSLLAVGGLVDAGVRSEIIRRVAQAQGAGELAAGLRSARQGVTMLAASSAAVAAVVSASASPLVSFVFPGLASAEHAQIRAVLIALAVILAVNVTNASLFGIASGLQRGDIENFTTVVAALAGAVTMVLTVREFHLGLHGMVIGTIVSTVILIAGQQYAARALTPYAWPFSRVTRRGMAGYLGVSGLLFVSQLADVVDVQFDKVVLSKFVDSAAVTEYQIGTMLSLNLRAFALVPVALLLAGITELWARDPARAERLMRTVTQLTYLVGGVLMTGVVVFARPFIELWLGPGYGQAVTASRLLAVAMAVNLVGAPWSSYAIGRGWAAMAAWSATANMVANAALSWTLVRRIGFDGALYGSLAGNAIGILVLSVLLTRATGRDWLLPAARPVSICVALGGSALFLVDHFPTQLDWPILIGLAFAFALTLAAALLGSSPRWLRQDVATSLRSVGTQAQSRHGT